MTVVSSIETSRLRLRPCSQTDLDALHALWTEPEVRRYLWDDEIISLEKAAEAIAKSEASFDRNWFGLWSVFFRGQREPIGFAGLRTIDATAEVEVLYGLHPRFWGRGLATEAAAAALEFGFLACRIERIWARADAPNRASFGVMQRLGMKPSAGPGSEAGLVCYAITAAEYASRPIP